MLGTPRLKGPLVPACSLPRPWPCCLPHNCPHCNFTGLKDPQKVYSAHPFLKGRSSLACSIPDIAPVAIYPCAPLFLHLTCLFLQFKPLLLSFSMHTWPTEHPLSQLGAVPKAAKTQACSWPLHSVGSYLSWRTRCNITQHAPHEALPTSQIGKKIIYYVFWHLFFLYIPKQYLHLYWQHNIDSSCSNSIPKNPRPFPRALQHVPVFSPSLDLAISVLCHMPPLNCSDIFEHISSFFTIIKWISKLCSAL